MRVTYKNIPVQEASAKLKAFMIKGYYNVYQVILPQFIVYFSPFIHNEYTALVVAAENMEGVPLKIRSFSDDKVVNSTITKDSAELIYSKKKEQPLPQQYFSITAYDVPVSFYIAFKSRVIGSPTTAVCNLIIKDIETYPILRPGEQFRVIEGEDATSLGQTFITVCQCGPYEVYSLTRLPHLYTKFSIDNQLTRIIDYNVPKSYTLPYPHAMGNIILQQTIAHCTHDLYFTAHIRALMEYASKFEPWLLFDVTSKYLELGKKIKEGKASEVLRNVYKNLDGFKLPGRNETLGNFIRAIAPIPSSSSPRAIINLEASTQSESSPLPPQANCTTLEATQPESPPQSESSSLLPQANCTTLDATISEPSPQSNCNSALEAPPATLPTNITPKPPTESTSTTVTSHSSSNATTSKRKKLRCCAKCNRTLIGMKTCAGCKNVWYCSPQHQKDDWKEHKPHCTQAQ